MKGAGNKGSGTRSLVYTVPGVQSEKQVRESAELKETQGFQSAKPHPIFPFITPFRSKMENDLAGLGM